MATIHGGGFSARVAGGGGGGGGVGPQGPVGPPGPMPVFSISVTNVPNSGGNPGAATWLPTGGSGTSAFPFTFTLGVPVGIPGAPGSGGTGGSPDFTAPGSINTTGGALPSAPAGTVLQLGSAGLTALVLEGQDPGGNAGIIRTRSTGGPFTSPVAVGNGRSLGVWYMDGYDGNAYTPGAQIICETTQAWTTALRGSRLRFWTIRTNQQNGSTALSIAGDGGVVCGPGAAGNGPGTLTAPAGVYIGSGNLDIGTGTIMIGGNDLLAFLGLAAGLAARVSELEKKVK